jgi:hypothetical protein
MNRVLREQSQIFASVGLAFYYGTTFYYQALKGRLYVDEVLFKNEEPAVSKNYQEFSKEEAFKLQQVNM